MNFPAHKPLPAQSAESKLQRSIFTIIRSLSTNEKFHIKKDEDYGAIFIEHEQEFVPDWLLQWSKDKQYYRVYIKVASKSSPKMTAGYPIMTINSSMTAAEFVSMVHLIVRRRAGNRSEG